MFTITLHKADLHKIAVTCACAGLLVASAFGVNAILSRGEAQVVSTTPTGLATTITGAPELATFLQGYGVEADVVTATVSSVTVPRKWDESFEAFNECIKESGLDLSKIKGKEVDKWTVMVPAQCTETIKTYAVVLVHKGTAVAAYYLQRPDGDVLPMPTVPQTGGALTEEEKAANASFAEGADQPSIETVTDTPPTQETAVSVEELASDGAFPTE